MTESRIKSQVRQVARAILFAMLAFPSLAGSSAAAVEPADCRPAASPRVTIETVQADIHRWFGRCVRLTGIVYRNRLLADRQAAIEAETTLDEDIRRSLAVFWVEGLTLDRPIRVEILGKIGSCAAHHEATARYAEQHPNLIVWTSGYCHTSSENYIVPAAIRRLSYRAVGRLTEAEVPIAHRELIEVPSSLRPEPVAAARVFIAAVAAGDEATFFTLFDPDAASEQERLAGQPTPDWLAERQVEARRALRRLRALGSPFLLPGLLNREQRVLIERSELEAARPSGMTICWCRGPDCAGRWPVMAVDADSERSRPYACVHANDFVIFQGGRAIQVATEKVEGVFVEPAWPRARVSAPRG